tara:strand:- start:314 stop:475 length:162 start_codon:yes stop_codon:yes gene_type:complete
VKAARRRKKIIDCRVQTCNLKRVIQNDWRVPACQCGNSGYTVPSWRNTIKNNH